MNQQEYTAFTMQIGSDIGKDFKSNPSWDQQGVVTEVAQNLLDFPDPYVEEAIAFLQESGVSDIQGRLVDDISKGISVTATNNSQAKTALSQKAQNYISKKIKILVDEGKEKDQAVAIAYDMARDKGFTVPEKKSLTSDEEKTLKAAMYR